MKLCTCEVVSLTWPHFPGSPTCTDGLFYPAARSVRWAASGRVWWGPLTLKVPNTRSNTMYIFLLSLISCVHFDVNFGIYIPFYFNCHRTDYYVICVLDMSVRSWKVIFCKLFGY